MEEKEEKETIRNCIFFEKFVDKNTAKCKSSLSAALRRKKGNFVCGGCLCVMTRMNSIRLREFGLHLLLLRQMPVQFHDGSRCKQIEAVIVASRSGGVGGGRRRGGHVFVSVVDHRFGRLHCATIHCIRWWIRWMNLPMIVDGNGSMRKKLLVALMSHPIVVLNAIDAHHVVVAGHVN